MAAKFIWVTGPSAIGKSTLVNGLKDLLRCDTINTGEILRSTYPLTKEVPDLKVLQLINGKIRTRKTNLGIIHKTRPLYESLYEQ